MWRSPRHKPSHMPRHKQGGNIPMHVDSMHSHPVVSRSEWIAARRALLNREKQATHLRDAVNSERLALPWVAVDKAYLFDTPSGRKSLAELFDGRTQLTI